MIGDKVSLVNVYTMILESFADSHCNMVCKINRYSITNHLVSIVNISIDEFKVIRESLYSCYLTH